MIYISFKLGEFEGVRNGRYFSDFTLESFARLLEQVTALRQEEHGFSGTRGPAGRMRSGST